MRKKEHYYKSLDIVGGQIQLSTMENGTKTPSQTLTEILQTGTIKPNTQHPFFSSRLCVNLPIGWYAANSYRENGMLFETEEKPDYCCPFDLMKLTEDPADTSATNQAKLIRGFGKFLRPSIKDMLDKFSCPANAEDALNEFRQSKGHKKTQTSGYNECSFFRPIQITPIALFGPDVKAHAQGHKIDYYPDIMKLSEALLYSSKYWRKEG